MHRHQAKQVADKLVSWNIIAAKDYRKFKEVQDQTVFIDQLIETVLLIGATGALYFLDALKQTNQEKLAKHLEGEASDRKKKITGTQSEVKGMFIASKI